MFVFLFFGGGDFKDILGEASPSHVFLAVMYFGLGPGLGEKSLNTDNIMQTYTHIKLVDGLELFSIHWEQSSQLTNIFQRG